MNKQRGFGLIELAICAALFIGVSLALKAAWDHFTDSYRVEGAQAQLDKDKPIISAEHEARLQAERERDSITDATARQSKSIAEERARADAAEKSARLNAISYAKEVALRKGRDAALKAAAAAAPTKGNCEALLSATDKILRESERIRQGITAPVAPAKVEVPR